MTDKKALKTLEFDKILREIANLASSERARSEIMGIMPFGKKADVENALTEVWEADKVLFEHSVHLSFAYDDIEVPLEKASVMSVLTCGELLKIARTLRVARALKSNIIKVADDKIVRIKDIAKNIFVDPILEDDIEKAIVSDTEVSDNASNELRTLRQRSRKIGENIKAKLHHFISSPGYAKYLQDNIVTIRGDRYVIPVKAEFKGAIPGLIHDQSSSGATIYVEPMVIIELNNDLKTVLLSEQREIERILRAFTLRVGNEAEDLARAFTLITTLDIIFAKAVYAYNTKSKRPAINDEGYFRIVKGRHPLIDPKKVVPNSISLGEKYDLLLITGPNTGGKTVALKLSGLIVAMSLAGIFVPASEADICVFDNIFCDIGDEQSIEQSLSTFSSHIANIIKILEKAGPKTLILLDELGAGTDPTEGASLAVSIADHILRMGAKAIITTHYNELKEYAVVTNRVANASMDFDPKTYGPLFNLIIGAPGMSNAILIAERLGLSKEITKAAREGIRGDKVVFENVLGSLTKAKKEAEENFAEAERARAEAEETLRLAKIEQEKLFLQREKLNENVKKETKRLVAEAMEEAGEIIEEIRTLLEEPTEQGLFRARNLRSSLKKYVVNEENEFLSFGEEIDGDIKAGDRVLVKSLQSEGVVAKVNPVKGEFKVKIGGLEMNAKRDNLTRLVSVATKAVPKENVSNYTVGAFSPEINLVGQTAEEAIYNLEAYLDKAVLAKVGEVRIIHGFGEGILRKAVQEFLRKSTGVKSYRDGKFGEGERGVTIAVLNK